MGVTDLHGGVARSRFSLDLAGQNFTCTSTAAYIFAMQSPTVGRAGAIATVVSFFAGIALTSGATGCGSDPADVAGAFSISLTNRENGCALGNWTVGAQSQGVPVTITQSGATASADVAGLARVALDLALGNHVYQGDVDGNDIALKIIGSRWPTRHLRLHVEQPN